MKSTNRFLVLLSAAALLSTMLLSTVGAGIALAGTYFSPAHVTTTGGNTLNWTGQGTLDGDVSSAQCSGDTPNPGDLLWIFTTDGYTLSGTPVLHVDNGTIGTYEFPAYDPPVKVNGAIVMKQVTVTV